METDIPPYNIKDRVLLVILIGIKPLDFFVNEF